MSTSKWSFRLLRSLGLVVAMLAGLSVASWQLHKSRTRQLFGELVTFVATHDSLVALTFDDGPAVPYTDSILDLLRVHRVPATFFVTGGSVQRYPSLARRIVEEGHELGNHSFSHQPLVLRSLRTIRHEVEATDSLIRAAGFSGTIHFRPPYGKRLVGLPWYLSRTERTTVLWTLEPDSWYRTAEAMTRHVLDNAEPGAIILLHVELRSREAERLALVRIIEGLRERGYGFVTVSELMAHGEEET